MKSQTMPQKFVVVTHRLDRQPVVPAKLALYPNAWMYTGNVTIAGIEFSVQVNGNKNVDDLREEAENGDTETVRGKFLITVRRNGEHIDLSEATYEFFFWTLIDSAIEINVNGVQSRGGSTQVEPDDNLVSSLAGVGVCIS